MEGVGYGGRGLEMRPRTGRIVERWMKAAETQWGATPHRPGRSQGRTLVLSLMYGADSTAAGRGRLCISVRILGQQNAMVGQCES